MRLKHVIKRLLAVVLLLMVLAAIATWFATQKLHAGIEQALGPDSEVAAIHLHWNGIEIDGLRIKAARNWPAEDELRARRIVIQPSPRSLFSRQLVIGSIEVDDAYLSLLRTTDGRMRVLPGLLDRKTSTGSGAMPSIHIEHIDISDAAFAFYDASVRAPPLPVRIEHLDAGIDDIQLPALTGKSAFTMEGTLKGIRHDGTLTIKGWADIASKDSEVHTRLRGVDLVALKPYLIKAADTGVKQGTLDLDLDSTVRSAHLEAPGTVTLHDLELDQSGGFMGLPRRAAVSLMQDKKNDIVVRFELNGDLADPAFKLNDNIASRFGAALAESLGVSVEGVARGASAVGGVLGSAAEGAGRAIKSLFGK